MTHKTCYCKHPPPLLDCGRFAFQLCDEFLIYAHCDSDETIEGHHGYTSIDSVSFVPLLVLLRLCGKLRSLSFAGLKCNFKPVFFIGVLVTRCVSEREMEILANASGCHFKSLPDLSNGFAWVDSQFLRLFLINEFFDVGKLSGEQFCSLVSWNDGRRVKGRG